MSETNDEVKNEQAIDEAIDNVPEAGEVFKDKSENNEEDTLSDAITEPAEDTGTVPEETDDEVMEKETKDENESETIPEMTEPLYQKKVYIVDLNNIGLKIDGEGTLIVDVMSIDKETQMATVKNGELTMEVPKEFLFSV